MDNQYLKVMADAKTERWCIRPWCTTCGSSDFRFAVASIDNLQYTLESVDLREMTSRRDWCDMLRITAVGNHSFIDWCGVLMAWLPYAREHINFADHVFFYLVTQNYSDEKTLTAWRDVCVEHAIRTKNLSLLESLVLRCDLTSSKYTDLVSTALSESEASRLLKNALVKAGFSQSENEHYKIQKSIDAGMNLFGTIRRNDVKAFDALMTKQPDLSVVNQDGQTLLAYARSISHQKFATVLETESSKSAQYTSS